MMVNDGLREQLLQDCAIAIDEALLTGRDPDSVVIPNLDATERAELAGIAACLTRLQGLFRPTTDFTLNLGQINVRGYDIQDQLGEGGMGVVYLARQTSLKRPVALKFLRFGGGPDECARLRIEAESAARLHHPNIIEVHEVGEHHGLPYFAMEYMDAGSLAEVLAGRPLPAMEAACVAETLARAVHHAHTQGIIHRDLKPANILLRRRPASLSGPPGILADNIIKLTDFGLAKVLSSTANMTRTGAAVGTPSYMAPEQALGRTNQVGPAVDVYSLGAVLYELLTGRPPFRGPSALETLEQVRNQEPMPPRRLQPSVPRDIETVCLKALEKAPQKRYASALALAEDLRRFQEGRVVLARPTGAVKRGLRWCRRNPLVAGLAAGLILATLASTTLAVTAHVQANRANERADAEGRARSETEEALYRNRILLVDRQWQANRVSEARRSLEECKPGEGGPDLREWEWYHLRARLHPELATSPHDCGALTTAVLSPDGQLVAASGLEGQVSVVEVGTGRQRFLKKFPGSISSVAFRPDGVAIAVGGTHPGGERGILRLIDPQTGIELTEFPNPTSVRAIAFNPNGDKIAATGLHGTAIWDVQASRRTLAIATGGDCIAWSSDAGQLAIGGQTSEPGPSRGRIVLWDIPGQRERRRWSAHGGAVWGVAFEPRTGRLATAGEDGAFSIWEANSDRPAISVFAHARRVRDIACSPRGEMVATAGEDNAIRVWDGRNGKLLRTYRGHANSPSSVRFSADGARLISAGGDGLTKLWDAHQEAGVLQFRAGTPRFFHLHPDGITALRVVERLQENGEFAASEMEVFDRATGQSHWRGSSSHQFWSVTLAPNGKQFVGADQDKLYVWNLDQAGADPTNVLAGGSPVAYSADGTMLATARRGGMVLVYDTNNWQQAGEFRHLDAVWSIAFSPRGRHIAAGGFSRSEGKVVKEVVVCDPRTGILSHRFNDDTVGHQSVAFSPDETHLAVAGAEARVRSLTTGELVFARQGATFHSVDFSASGQRLAFVTADSVKVLNLQGVELLDLPFDPGFVRQIAFNASRGCLVGYGALGATIWSTADKRDEEAPTTSPAGKVLSWELRKLEPSSPWDSARRRASTVHDRAASRPYSLAFGLPTRRPYTVTRDGSQRRRQRRARLQLPGRIAGCGTCPGACRVAVTQPGALGAGVLDSHPPVKMSCETPLSRFQASRARDAIF